MATFSEILEGWKKNVLQLDNRNPLINFRPPKQAVEIDTDGPYELVGRIVSGDSPLFDYARRLNKGFDDDSQPGNTYFEKHDLSSKDENPLDLQRKLGLLRSKERQWDEEQGINVLFLAFGILNWTDDEVDEQKHSPLLLLPCSLWRESPRDPFQLVPLDDVLEINETLKVKFENEFGFIIPEFSIVEEDELSEALLRYIHDFEQTSGYKPDWSIKESLFLYTFTSSKMAIYRDLDRIQSNGTEHKIVNGFTRFDPSSASQRDTIHSAGYSDDYGNLDGAKLDDLLDLKQETAVLPADYSQLIVLDKLRKGNDLVVHGPPGTGKSQTIVNMIATCMAEGKSVLFVSEKKAALDVVKRRLKEVKLDDLALDLHSDSGKKSNVYEQLRLSMNVDMEVSAPAIDFDDLVERRATLNKYARSLHAKRSPLGMSVFDLYGALTRLQEFPDIDIPKQFIESLTVEKLRVFVDQLDQLAVRDREFLEHHSSKWRSLKIDEPRLSLSRDLRSTSIRIKDFFTKCCEHGSDIYDGLGISRPLSIQEVEIISNALQQLASAPIISHKLLKHDHIEDILSEAIEQISLVSKRDKLKLELEDVFGGEIPKLDHQSMLREINIDGRTNFIASEIFGTNWQGALITERGNFTAIVKDIEEILIRLRDIVDSIESLLGINIENSDLIDRISNTISDFDQRTSPKDYQSPEKDSVYHESINIVRNYLYYINQLDVVPHGWLERPKSEIEFSLLDAKQLSNKLIELEQSLSKDLDLRSANELDRHVLIRYRTDYQNKFNRLFSRQYRKDRNIVRASLTRMQKMDFDGEHEFVERIFVLKDVRSEWNSLRESLSSIFKDINIDEKTDWDYWISRFELFSMLSELWPKQDRTFEKFVSENKNLITARALLPELDSILDNAEALFSEHELVTGSHVSNTLDISALIASVSDLHKISRSINQNVLSELGERFVHTLNGKDLSSIKSTLDSYGQFVALNLSVYQIDKYPEFKHDSEGSETDYSWIGLKHAIEWIETFKTALGTIEEKDRFEEFVHRPIKQNIISDYIGQINSVESEYHVLMEELKSDPIFQNAPWLEEETIFSEIIDWAEEIHDDADSAIDWATYMLLVKEIDELVAFSLVDRLRKLTKNSRDVSEIVLKHIYQRFADRFSFSEPSLRIFNDRVFEQMRQNFATLDMAVAREQSNRIREKVLTGYPNRYETNVVSSGLGILRSETNKRRRQLPVRFLLQRLNELIKTYKPCYLMSPLAVSQYIELTEGFFDVVIFDEASQILPEEAIPSIIRAKQVVMAGDQNQMPPTMFGRTLNSDFDEDVDEDEYLEQLENDEASANQFAGKESILDVAVATIGSLFDESHLNVHYRSKDESLIRFSNRWFYENRLITFPSSSINDAEFGISGHFVSDGIYDRGASRTNRREADLIVDLVFRHMREHPDESIGVAAMSVSQANLIQELIDHRRISEPDFDDRFSLDHPENIFVKNLENVQGDERDRIILSIGYGPTYVGEQNPPNNFGPLNIKGGERRLNVLITRARKRLDVVYSIKPSQITSQGAGPRLMRNFLEYVEDPDMIFGMDPISGEIQEHDSPFETAVEDELTRRGYRVARQVGASRYRIDLAIISDSGTKYDLGIECDGATFHSSPAARDRDWLRQKVLESLGWKISRIWSTAWIRNKENELRRIESDIKAARDKPSPMLPDESASDDNLVDFDNKIEIQPVTVDDLDLEKYERTVLERAPTWKDLKLETFDYLEGLADQIVTFEGPVHKEIVYERIRDHYGLRVLRGSTRERVERVVSSLTQPHVKAAGKPRFKIIEGEFLYTAESQLLRSPREAPDVNISHYYPRDLKHVIFFAAKEAYGISSEDLLTETTRILGYRRTGSNIKIVIGEAIENLVSIGKLIKGESEMITTVE